MGHSKSTKVDYFRYSTDYPEPENPMDVHFQDQANIYKSIEGSIQVAEGLGSSESVKETECPVDNSYTFDVQAADIPLTAFVELLLILMIISNPAGKKSLKHVIEDPDNLTSSSTRVITTKFPDGVMKCPTIDPLITQSSSSISIEKRREHSPPVFCLPKQDLEDEAPQSLTHDLFSRYACKVIFPYLKSRVANPSKPQKAEGVSGVYQPHRQSSITTLFSTETTCGR